jgi:hypothetical protein
VTAFARGRLDSLFLLLSRFSLRLCGGFCSIRFGGGLFELLYFTFALFLIGLSGSIFLGSAELGSRISRKATNRIQGFERHLSLLETMYWPLKYSRGLTRKQNAQRKRSATRRTKMSFKDPKAYVPFKSDTGVKTRRSSYSSRFHRKYPEAKTLPEIAKATGISESTLQTVYNRGMAAWRTGHRPGASQHAWGMARVHSFVLKGKTARTADADLARKTYRRKT